MPSAHKSIHQPTLNGGEGRRSILINLSFTKSTSFKAAYSICKRSAWLSSKSVLILWHSFVLTSLPICSPKTKYADVKRQRHRENTFPEGRIQTIKTFDPGRLLETQQQQQQQQRMNVSGGVLPVWSCVGPRWTVGVPEGWMSHSAPDPPSLVQPQKDK